MMLAVHRGKVAGSVRQTWALAGLDSVRRPREREHPTLSWSSPCLLHLREDRGFADFSRVAQSSVRLVCYLFVSIS